MLKGKIRKLIAALVLVGFVGSAGLPIMAEAASYQSENVQEQRIEHKKENKKIECQKEKQKKQKYKEKQNKNYNNHDKDN